MLVSRYSTKHEATTTTLSTNHYNSLFLHHEQVQRGLNALGALTRMKNTKYLPRTDQSLRSESYSIPIQPSNAEVSYRTRSLVLAVSSNARRTYQGTLLVPCNRFPLLVSFNQLGPSVFFIFFPSPGSLFHEISPPYTCLRVFFLLLCLLVYSLV